MEQKRNKGTCVRLLLKGVSLAIVVVLASAVARSQIYVSPTGNDSYPGTLAQPFKTLTKAMTVAAADSLIYMRGGSYVTSSTITISKSGTAGHPIKVWAYPGEDPVLDFSSQTGTSADGVKLNGSYIYFKGVEFTGAPHNGLNVEGHYNIVEHCTFHDNRNSGFQMGSSSGTTYPRGNLVLNCDSYLNYDAPIGGNADGYAIKWNIGSGNAFTGCRAWNNSDDGWDLWMADSSVVIDSCFAFRNGVDSWHSGQFDGNGNGFKLGGNNVATPHTTMHCVSFDNAGNTGRGFDENNNLGGQTVYNCTAYRNQGDNYHFNNSVTVGAHMIKNCISYVGNVSITSGTRQNNSWQGFTVSTSDFLSLDTSLAVAPRNADGGLPLTLFMRLAAGSSLVDAGQNVGLPFNGSAPDLGAYETGSPLPIQLASFTGQARVGSILLRWTTLSEIDNYGFYVQRRTPLETEWVELPHSFTPGHGTTTEPQYYEFIDSTATAGAWMYRLQQVDLDGSTYVSFAIQINALTGVKEGVVPSRFGLLQNYPNPFNPETTIGFTVEKTARATVTIYSVLGQQVAVLYDGVAEAGRLPNVKFSGTNLPSGVYFYRLQSGGNVETKKLILMK